MSKQRGEFLSSRISSVGHCRCCSATQSCQTLCNSWTIACQPSLSLTISQSLLKLMSIELVTLANYLIICRCLLFLPSIFPSIRIFSSGLALCIRWPKYWSFSIKPSSEYSGLISFRIEYFELLAVQGTVKSLLQYHVCWQSDNLWFFICYLGLS